MSLIDEKCLDRFRSCRACQFCGRPTPSGTDPHHCWGRGFGGGSRLDIPINVIGLCFQCHREDIPAGRITREMILDKIAAREKTTAQAIRTEVNRLRWGRE